MAKKCVSYPECGYNFTRLEEKLDAINNSLERHITGSEQRSQKFNDLATDVAVIKSRMSDDKYFSEKIDSAGKWRIGIAVGVFTFIFTMIFNGIKLLIDLFRPN